MIHPRALVESDQIGDGTRVWAFAHILEGAVVGKNCNVCDHSFIEKGAVLGNNVTVKNGVAIWDRVTIEDNCFIGPNAVFTNDMNPRTEYKKQPEDFDETLIHSGSTIGANATIVCGSRLGHYSFIGAGAVVRGTIPDYALFVGVPARQIGWMCRCATKLNEELICPDCQSKYEECDSGLKPLSEA